MFNLPAACCDCTERHSYDAGMGACGICPRRSAGNALAGAGQSPRSDTDSMPTVTFQVGIIRAVNAAYLHTGAVVQRSDRVPGTDYASVRVDLSDLVLSLASGHVEAKRTSPIIKGANTTKYPCKLVST